MKGIIRGVGVFLLIASIIALLLFYYCLSRIKRGEEQERVPLLGNGRNKLWEIPSQWAGNHIGSISDNSPGKLSFYGLPFHYEPQW